MTNPAGGAAWWLPPLTILLLCLIVYVILLNRGDVTAARDLFQKRLELPVPQLDRDATLSNIGLKYAKEGNWSLAALLTGTGTRAAAAAHLAEVIRVVPRLATAQNGTGLNAGHGPRRPKARWCCALHLAEEAVRQAGRHNAVLLDSLAAAYAETKQFQQASASAEESLKQCGPTTDLKYRDEIRRRLELYRAGQPYRTVAECNGASSRLN